MKKVFKKIFFVMAGTLVLTQMGSVVSAKENSPVNTDIVDKNSIPAIEKSLLKVGQMEDLETGRIEFWNSVSPEDMKYYYFHNDGSVSLREEALTTFDEGKRAANEVNTVTDEEKTATKKVKDFEEKWKNYISKVDALNKSKGLNVESFKADSNGNIGIGDSTGSGSYSNYFDYSGIWKGMVFLGDRPGVEAWGWVTHAGIYDGTKDDACIWSASGPGLGVRWEFRSDWAKEFNDIYALDVKNTSLSQNTAAFDTAKSLASAGETYSWNASKGDNDEWYCSKVPFRGYKDATGIDIDFDSGYWVWPVDIYNDGDTKIVKRWNQ